MIMMSYMTTGCETHNILYNESYWVLGSSNRYITIPYIHNAALLTSVSHVSEFIPVSTDTKQNT